MIFAICDSNDSTFYKALVQNTWRLVQLASGYTYPTTGANVMFSPGNLQGVYRYVTAIMKLSRVKYQL